MATTNAVVVPERDRLELREVEVRPPGPGEVQVEVAAAGVNFIDVYQRQGVYPMDYPFVLGNEGAGTVVGTGARVAWAQQPGAAAGVVTLPEEHLVPVPDEVELDVAAAVMLQGMTAHYLLDGAYHLKSGDAALVHAAAGGVGQLLVQMIQSRGGRVVATAGSEEKRQLVHDLGVEHVLEYGDDPDAFAQEVRAASDGRGVDVAYDGVGRATFDGSLASLRRRGTMVLFGGSSGQVPPFDLQRLNTGGSLFVTRPTLTDYIATRDELLNRAQSVLGAVADGVLHVAIGGRYGFSQVEQAYADLEARRTTGKLLLLPE